SAAGGTFSRASVGTYFDSAGVLQTAASGVPRFDYDPITHAAKGILIEESRANLWQDSEAFNNPFWIASQVTVSPNVTISPAGTMTAEKITEASGGTFHYVGLTPNYSANTTRTVSVYAKAAERQWLRVYADDGSGNSAYANFNLGTGTYDFVGGNNSYTSSAMILNVGNGWYRCILTYSIATATTRVQFIMRTTGGTGSSSYAGDGSSGLYLWGAQIEQGAFATSYIPTTTTAVTRVADRLTIPIGVWFTQDSGSTVTEFDRNQSSSSSAVLALTNASNLQGPINYYNSSSGLIDSAAGVSLTKYKDYSSFGAISDTNGHKVGISYSGSIFATSILKLGQERGSLSGFELNGHLKKFKYYPLRAADTQLQLLTQ
ncbi:MAG: hypothetical protein A3J37_07980, partial [Alphaproteobacteria bacterium RIFCSPHIGHO2_12_FULL_45_9]